jgi:hypothetical protein
VLAHHRDNGEPGVPEVDIAVVFQVERALPAVVGELDAIEQAIGVDRDGYRDAVGAASTASWPRKVEPCSSEWAARGV